MYETITYEGIMSRMLAKVLENNPEIDTREGSIIYNALAPAAVELQNMYIELDYCLNQYFADTQDRDSLVRRCKDQGLTPYPATKAVLKGEFNQAIPLGSRFSAAVLNYCAIEKITDNTYHMECETPGTVGNTVLGTMVPVEYIAGLTKAELTEVLQEGTDEEDTERLRQRYYIAVQKPSTSGNKYDYYNWAMECAGVGAAKVFPLSNGPGTVKVVITNANMTGASAALVEAVKNHIEELRPIGADVSVISAIEKVINIRAKVRLQSGLNLGTIQTEFAVSMEEFLQGYALQASYISVARLGNLLINIPGVEDYAELLLNDTAANVQLSEEETAIMGKVVLEVM